MDFNRIINFSTDIGTLMLENGAETYRVEEIMSRICLAYGIEKVDVFVIPTNIIITIKVNEMAISRTRRVNNRTINLDKISKLNNLSRNVTFNNLSIEAAENKLNSIANEKEYSIISGALVSLLAFIAVKFNIAPNMNEIIIGSLMPLVPGLAITNSLRDIIDGNLVAGSAKFIEAFFIAVGIAIGSAGILSILIN